MILNNFINIRLATQSDIPELAQIYRDSVNAIAFEYYSPEQVESWAMFSEETEAFSKFILDATTFILELKQKIIGFSGIKNDGHVVSVYVHPDYLRQGIGSKLMAKILGEAESRNISCLYSEASEFSKPLFEKFGFKNYDIERVIRNGVWFERYLMQRGE